MDGKVCESTKDCLSGGVELCLNSKGKEIQLKDNEEGICKHKEVFPML